MKIKNKPISTKKRKSGSRKLPRKPTVLANNASPRPLSRKQVAKPRTTVLGVRHSQGVCAIANPFCIAAKGSKWPDGTMGNTMVEQFRGNVTISSFAAGDSLYTFAAASPFGYLTPASSAGGNVTMNGAYTTYKSSSILATFGTQYRITSMGVIVRSVASATNSAGLVTFGTTGTLVGSSSVMVLGTELYDETVVKAIQPGLEFCWVAQPRGVEVHQFIAQSSAGTVNTDWTALVIEVTGATASIPLLNVEWFVNVEFTLKTNSTMSALAPRNPPSSVAAVQAVSKIHSTLGSFIEGGITQVEHAFMEHAGKALESVFNDPLASIAGLFI